MSYANPDKGFKPISANKVSKKRRNKDTQELIQTILNTPLHRGRCIDAEMCDSIDDIKGLNVDMQTRIFTQIALQAGNGDVKSAAFLMKYGGLEPEERRTVTIDLPQFIDDVTPRAALAEQTEQLLLERALERAAKKEEEEEEENDPMVIVVEAEVVE